MKLTVKTRLTLWFVTLMALILATWSVLTLTLLSRELYGAIDRLLVHEAGEIAAGVVSNERAAPGGAGGSLPEMHPGEVATQLLARDGHLVASAGTTATVSPMIGAEDAGRLSSSGGTARRTLWVKGERFQVLAVSMRGSSEVVVVAASTRQADNALIDLLFVILVTGPAVLVVAVVGGRWLAGRALAPVADMTQTAAAIRAGGLDERIAVPPGDDELTHLAQTLNSMLARLETDAQDKRRLVADASHELKTPLAVMRTEIDVALAAGGLRGEAVEVLKSAREEVDRMTQIVGNLLTLARSDGGNLHLLRGPLDLRVVALEVAKSLETLAADKDATVSVEGTQVIAEADEEYVRQVVVNLVQNAIQYSGRGSSVAIRTRSEAPDAVLEVSDDGPGIPEEALEHVFDRFYRVEGSRSRSRGGSGLGLAISREVVAAHGGRIDVVSVPGEGSVFTVRLPAAQ